MRINFFQKIERLEVDDYLLSRIKSIHPAICFRDDIIEFCVFRKDVDHREAMTLAHRVVVEVMRRGNLHAAGSEFWIHIAICNDRDLSISQR